MIKAIASILYAKYKFNKKDIKQEIKFSSLYNYNLAYNICVINIYL